MTVQSTLLICNIGSSLEPIVASLKHWQPKRCLFIVSPETKEDPLTKVLPQVKAEGFEIEPYLIDRFVIPDGQDLSSTLTKLRDLSSRVSDWNMRSEDHRTIVDITGGTKAMSCALALTARRWACTFSYVGGTNRTKNGVGVVVSGAEKILTTSNAWDVLGYQVVDDFITHFNQNSYLAAAECLQAAKKNATDGARKRELNSLELLAKALKAWDDFDHKGSKHALSELLTSTNDFRAALGTERADLALNSAQILREHLLRIESPTESAQQSDSSSRSPGNHYQVIDLLANAHRRLKEKRFDDAVARAYRAIEATAQVALHERHRIANTGKVPMSLIPDALAPRWSSHAINGELRLGLQDAYLLLTHLGDPLGARFNELGLSGTKSLLVRRNESILAHGFKCVSEKAAKNLFASALALNNLTKADLPSFPPISASPDVSQT